MSANLNGYAVNILGKSVTYFTRGSNSEYNYFSLPHLTEYTIKLSNNHLTRCDAEIFVDGDSVGMWRIEPLDTIKLERPANLNRRFVFVVEKSHVAKQAGVRGKSDNGLITVVFTPENKSPSCLYFNQPYLSTASFYDKNQVTYLDANSDGDSMTMKNAGDSRQVYQNSTGSIKELSSAPHRQYSSGATILGAGTDQHFTSVQKLRDIDYDNVTTINIRLVVAKNDARPYISIGKMVNETQIDQDIDLVHKMNDRLFGNDRVSLEKPYY